MCEGIIVSDYKPITEKELAEQTQRKRGGARPGSGRKLGSGNGFVDKIQVCVTPQQKNRFEKLGAAKWLRAYLNEETISSQLENKRVVRSELDTDPKSVQKPCQDGQGGCLSVPLTDATGHAAGQLNLKDYVFGQCDSCIAVIAGSDDMRLAGIAQGDLVIVDKSLTPEDGDLVLICRRETFVARRFRFVKSRRIELHTERLKGKDRVIDLRKDTGFDMLGVIISVVRKTR